MRPTGLLQLEHSPQEYALTPQAVGTGERERASGYIALHIMQSTTINLIYTHHPPSKRAKYPHYAALKLDPVPCSGPTHARVEWCMHYILCTCTPCEVHVATLSLVDMPHDTVSGLPYNHQWFAVPSHVLTEPVDSLDQVG